MFEYHTAVRRIVLACGTVDLCRGINGLAMIIGEVMQCCQKRQPQKALRYMGTPLKGNRGL